MNRNRLTEIRENNDLTQRTIAKLLGVEKSTYSRWETLERIIPLNRLNDYCNFFNLSMDYVMNLTSTNNETKKLKNIDNKIIGTRLKFLRKKFNITQEILALQLNTTHSTISAYETGKTTLLTIFALDICHRYNVSLDWLCGKSEIISINKTN